MTEKLGHEVILTIVNKLVGATRPTGSHSEDGERLYNLQTKINVVDELLSDMVNLIDFKEDYRISMKEIGKESYVHLKRINDFLTEVLEEESQE